MNILRLKARFGRLYDEELKLSPGLNIITSPNESGKSTWCAFITAMLYGIDTSERESAGHLPDKTKYLPANGCPMGGEMDLELEGERVTLTRETKKPSLPMKEFSARYTGTAQDIPGWDAAGCGEKCTGMSRSVFHETVLIGNDLSVHSGPELERRIAAMTTTGNENASWSEVSSRLRMWQRARYYNKSTGAIPALEEEAQKLQTVLSVMQRASAEEVRLQNEIAAARSSQEERDSLARQQEENRQAELEEARIALGAAQVKAGAAREEYASAQQALDEAADAVPSASQSGEKREEKPLLLLSVILALGAVAALFAGTAFHLPLPYFLIPALLAACCAVTVFFYRKARGSIHSHAALLQDAAALTAELSRKLEEKKKALDAAIEEMEVLRSRCDALSSPLAAPAPARTADEMALTLERLRGKAEALGDPLEIASRLKENEQKQKRLHQEYDAITLALDVLSSADAELTSRFSPALTEKASEYMALLTDGRYDRLTFDRNLRALARPSVGGGELSTLILSTGTADQLYLSLRLAIAELTDSNEDKCPLILDDALLTFDDERMALAMKLLKEISQTRQVILFTCHRREQRWLEKN